MRPVGGGALVLGLALWLGGAAIAPAAPTPRKTISPSQQFIIYCDDFGLRSKLSEMAEATAGAWQTVLDSSDKWQMPIVITVRPAAADGDGSSGWRFQMFDTEDGGKISIELAIGSEADRLPLQNLLARAVLLEYARRGTHDPAAGAPLPLWLVDGFTERLRVHEAGADASLFESLLTSGHLPTAAQVIGRRRIASDSTSRALDAACSFSLFQLLADEPGGPAALARYLRQETSSPGDPLADFTKFFPRLASSPASLEKWWALSVARLSASDRYRGLALDESNRRLEAALNFQVPSGPKGELKKFTLHDWPSLVKEKAAPPILRGAQDQLRELAAHGHPLLRETVVSYDALLSSLLRRKTRGFAEKLAAVEKSRADNARRMAAITDYLNWYEASVVQKPSDTFGGYLEAAKETPPEPRNDPISRYLDTIVTQSQ